MKNTPNGLRLSATDLSNHLACGHLTERDLCVALHRRAAPEWNNPDALVLQERGREHEAAYLTSVTTAGMPVVDLRDVFDDEAALARTLAAMGDGVAVIAQAALRSGLWFGRADVLRRVETPSALGAWSYEVYDCKLARNTKAGTILQLSLYSDLLESAQGFLPLNMHVVVPGEGFPVETHRVLDYAAYYRLVRNRLQSTVANDPGWSTTYPEPVSHCDECRWWQECDRQRREDDHLCLVAGISRVQQKQLASWETTTVAALAQLPLPLQQRPDQGSRESYERVREQARVQVTGREAHQPVHELLPLADGQGLARLPVPSPGDLFLDFEGDPFAGYDGREYLFGFVTNTEPAAYHYRWALTPEEERAAFEWLVDTIIATWTAHQGMHVYHFTAYEPSALKRLMGRYATREDEIDRILRAGILVDVHTVLKQGVRASVEQYSLKAIEAFYEYERLIPLDTARTARHFVEHTLELSRTTTIDQETKRIIEGYNRDDCASTKALRDWLETQRATIEQAGRTIPRPATNDGAPPPAVDERQERVAQLVTALTADIPADETLRTPAQAATWLLANLIDFYRREDKANWWEYFRLNDLPDDDRLDDKNAIAGLAFDHRAFERGRLPTDTYNYPKQETGIKVGDDVYNAGQKIGSVTSIAPVHRTISIKKTGATADLHPISVFAFKRVSTDELADSIFRLATWVLENGIDAPGPHRAARDLLLRHPPRRTTTDDVTIPGEDALAAAKRLGNSLSQGVLPIQGPPGAGKTFIGARMIVDLIRRGKKVGVTAVSHAVIRNLLDEVITAARAEGFNRLGIVHKVTTPSATSPAGITEVTANDRALTALTNSTAQLVGGTAWLWAREDFQQAVDVLVVDEAGQMSLANVLAVAQATTNVILLGDPQQLDQPLRGAHPIGADASALAHLLGEHQTIPKDRGLFLPETWRLHPSICAFTSEVFYENRLTYHDGLQHQCLNNHEWLGPAGLYYVPVAHNANTNSAPEEVECITHIVESLLDGTVTWTNKDGHTQALTRDDILVVAPYNAQVNDLAANLNARVGTVDKFQGQQAPVVIYSLTTSTPEDAPRGMEFLYSMNRLNVATSRARAVVIIVGSPRLFEPHCNTPRQMQLANALCRYQELAATATARGSN